MASEEWRPAGPAVCRCCFAEGCYKDISSEYFWMGKKEVYADMLNETFNINISHSKWSGPSSTSRLICEACIARLRDAAEFKKQVVECEKTFMQHLDPTTSSLQPEVECEVPAAEVKLEGVKVEKLLEDEDDFDNRMGFDDDDEDMDQPLVSLASKVPKKEQINVLDLLKGTEVVVKKKKSVMRAKEPLQKVKVKKVVRPAPPPKPDKAVPKKKGRNPEEVTYIKEEDDGKKRLIKFEIVSANRRRDIFLKNIQPILELCTACPFKYKKGIFLCFFCKNTYLNPEELRHHTRQEHLAENHPLKPTKYDQLKIDFAAVACKLCGEEIEDYIALKTHLATSHGKTISKSLLSVILPYKLYRNKYDCQICSKRYETFLSLHRHMNEHYELFICETCGKGFSSSQRLVSHSKTHERGKFPCSLCGEVFASNATLQNHRAKVHHANKRHKCPICHEKFVSYKHRLKHLQSVHGTKVASYPCEFCPKVFDLCSRRTLHVRSHHLQERNHVCSECGMTFFANHELKEHAVKHGGERIFQCDVCKKAYARLKTLREHMRIHNNDRRFACVSCGAAFVQKCSLKQHLRVHHPSVA